MTRLKACDLAVCEGMCCHDGAWLEAGEVPRLRRLVFQRRRELPHVPDRFLEPVGETWKTSTRPFRYSSPEHPAHFPHTRCVFALADARCGLQVLAEADGVHKWAYKPRACWMHPLREGASGLLPPPLPEADWDRAPDYPGYVAFTACGRHQAGGDPWEAVLAEEMERWGGGRG